MSVKKDELLKMIEDAMLLEDRAIQIYRKHLVTAIFWSGLTEWGREQVAIALNMLGKESERHAVKLAALKERIEQESRDVY